MPGRSWPRPAQRAPATVARLPQLTVVMGLKIDNVIFTHRLTAESRPLRCGHETSARGAAGKWCRGNGVSQLGNLSVREPHLTPEHQSSKRYSDYAVDCAWTISGSKDLLGQSVRLRDCPDSPSNWATSGWRIFASDSTRRLVPARVQRLFRRWTLPNGAPRGCLSLPSVFKNCRDVAAELLSHPLTCSVNRVDYRVTIRYLLHHRPPFLPACK